MSDNSSIGKRIEQIVESSGLKKVEFAKKLNISQSYIPKMISDKVIPSDRMIEDICEKFSINEEWLRYGTGEPRKPISVESVRYIDELLKDEDSPINFLIASIMESYVSLNNNDKEAVKRFIKNLLEQKK